MLLSWQGPVAPFLSKTGDFAVRRRARSDAPHLVLIGNTRSRKAPLSLVRKPALAILKKLGIKFPMPKELD
jgi:hypothetical protein